MKILTLCKSPPKLCRFRFQPIPLPTPLSCYVVARQRGVAYYPGLPDMTPDFASPRTENSQWHIAPVVARY